ncbi:hypothetical protein SAMN04487898_12383 [Pedobacter sp. ok626]|nr:hypothetical protein SAMN04487898_12383 [Pedobacter sp. ok626]
MPLLSFRKPLTGIEKLLPRPNSLKILAFYTTKAKIDKIIKERLKSMGYTDGLDRD